MSQFKVTLSIYDPIEGERRETEEVLPTRTTKTGKEHHFDRAYQDASIIRRAYMNALNGHTNREHKDFVIVDIKRIFEY